jgi:UrcA family protein
MFFKNFAAPARMAGALATASASLALVALPAHADPYSHIGQDTTAASEEAVEGVTVYAPERYARQPTTGARVRMDRVSTTVQLGDLDLSNPYDARVAKARIVEAAKDVCDEADTVYPNDGQPPGGCYSIAVRDALRQAQDMAGYPIVAWGYR